MQRKNCGNQESCSLSKNAKIQTLGTHNLLYKLTLNLFTIFATVVETTKFILCAVEFQNIRGKYVFRKILVNCKLSFMPIYITFLSKVRFCEPFLTRFILCTPNKAYVFTNTLWTSEWYLMKNVLSANAITFRTKWLKFSF